MSHPLDLEDKKPVTEFPDPDRRQKAKKVREAASALANAKPYDDHLNNKDKQEPYIFNFTKGLGHKQNGILISLKDYEDFVAGTEVHDPTAFETVTPYTGPYATLTQADLDKLGDQPYREWESPTAGHAYVLQGPDPQAITMPPAPQAGSAEFAAEMAEVYEMALLRDCPAASFMHQSLIDGLCNVSNKSGISGDRKSAILKEHNTVTARAKRLGELRWFQGVADGRDTKIQEERVRRRFGQALEPKKGLSASTMFRGIGEDPWETPFLSQFMVMGTGGGDRAFSERASGKVRYGAQRIDQSVRVAAPGKDYMTTWLEFLDVQNGANTRPVTDGEFVAGAYRPMSLLRDLASYVHDDALYQAYLNAALIMLGENFAIDPGIPYHANTSNPLTETNREPFALFGPPHLLTLVTEVSSRALKAVRFQKFSIHRRLRPEAAGALFHTIYSGYQPDRGVAGSEKYPIGDGSPEAKARMELGRTLAQYTFPHTNALNGTDPVLEKILEDVREHNEKQNDGTTVEGNPKTWLLPMAFPEGSPMHPAYGAGHATVAGACVTLLKAFFAMSEIEKGTNMEKPVYLVEKDDYAVVPDAASSDPDDVPSLLGVKIPEGLTLEGELNKLMWNISNGRNVGGVHYYTDYVESALLGEAITIGLLREQMLCYHPKEQVTMTVPLLVKRTLPEALLSGSAITPTQEVEAVKIRSDGTLEAVDPTPGRTH
ncbi:MAG: bromoperoxidase [Pseudomonadota bacterium]